VDEVAVVAARDDILGEVPVAFLTLRDGVAADLTAVRLLCRSRLPAHKIPVRFIIRADLPKLGTTGKINKVALRALAEKVDRPEVQDLG
jgi:long-chain acyl-CoA synthetase